MRSLPWRSRPPDAFPDTAEMSGSPSFRLPSEREPLPPISTPDHHWARAQLPFEMLEERLGHRGVDRVRGHVSTRLQKTSAIVVPHPYTSGLQLCSRVPRGGASPQ